MSDSNQMGWAALLDTENNYYIPMRQARRFSRADNFFTDRNKCQDECDRRNTKYERPTPLELIPERRHQ